LSLSGSSPHPVAFADGSARSAAVTRLALTDFRGYASLRLELDARPVLLTGPNGGGKTNVLEAVSFLSPGRGLRGAALDEVGRRDAQMADARPWAVAATVATQAGAVEIGTGLAEGLSTAGARRVVRVDGKPQRGHAALAEHLGMLWVTPETDKLFGEGNSARRRFLDRLVFGLDAAHAGRLAAYERALRERARLLRAPRLGGPPADHAWIAALERTMAEQGVAVIAARLALIARLNEACKLGVGPFPAAGMALEGEVEELLAEMPALDAEEVFRERLARARVRDAETGGAALGPQRSELAVTHLVKCQPAARCSTGEQKALLVAIVLADARLRVLDHGAAPVLLLDEVAAHLDDLRREALYAEIAALGLQAWMTGTDEAPFAALAGQVQHFCVRDAALTLA
jgi:DNA replication and repair protein RecF